MIDPSAKIHPSSVVEEGATLGAGCEIGPFCVIGPKVVLGQNVICHSHVAISGDTVIGDETKIWPFASLGHAPQDLKYRGEETKLRIGKHNMIRESTSIHLGTVQDQGITEIGDHNLFMLGSHIAHDCKIGSHCVFANNAAIAGHVTIEDHVIVGGLVGVVQFVRIGTGAMLGAGSLVDADVIPYGMTVGERPYLKGLNYVGMKRGGMDREGLHMMRGLYEQLFDGSEGLRARAEALQGEVGSVSQCQAVLDFILAGSERAFLSPKDHT